MLQQISRFFIYNIQLVSYLFVYNNFRLIDLDPKNVYVWIAGFLIVDLGYYMFHRAAHEINLFWASHVVRLMFHGGKKRKRITNMQGLTHSFPQ